MISLPNENPYWEHYRHSTAFQHSQNRYDNKFTGEEKIYLYAGLNSEYASPMPNLTTGANFIDIFCADLEGKQEEHIIKAVSYTHLISKGNNYLIGYFDVLK